MTPLASGVAFGPAPSAIVTPPKASSATNAAPATAAPLTNPLRLTCSSPGMSVDYRTSVGAGWPVTPLASLRSCRGMEQAASSGDAWFFGREAEQRVERVRRYRSRQERGAFGAALRRLRLRQKITQRELAAALHLPGGEITALETGERPPR